MTDKELINKYVDESKREEALEKLEKGYPVQYIIGNTYFYNSIIKVNENVLIPRFETEYLVEKTLKYLNKLNIKNPKVLEIGTGSGCISIALKKEIECNILAIDISNKALKLANENALDNNVDIDFLNIDINEFNTSNKYNLIISNPPYVAFDKKVDEKTKYEPQNAIFAPDNGIYFYKLIISKLYNNLCNDYLIAFEIDDKEGSMITDVIKKYLPNSYIKIEKDYNNYERYLFISNKEI